MNKLVKILLVFLLIIIWFQETIYIYGYSIATLFLGATLFIWLFSKLIQKTNYKKIIISKNNFKILVLILFFIIISFTSIIFSENLTISLMMFKKIIVAISLFIIIFDLVNSKIFFVKVYKSFVFSGIIANIVLIIGYLNNLSFVMGKSSIISGGIRRVTGTFANDPNYAALNIVLFIPLAYYLFKYEKNKINKMFSLIGVFSGVIAVGLTYSRSGMLLIIILGFLIMINSKYKVRFLLGLSFFSFILLFISPDVITSRFKTIFDFVYHDIILNNNNINYTRHNSSSLVLRYYLLKSGILMFLNNLLFGIGIGNFQFLSLEYGALTPQVAHNSYISIAAELGIFGILTFGLIIGLTWLQTNKIISNVKEQKIVYLLLGLRTSYIIYLIGILFLDAQYEKGFWFIIALLMSAYKITKRSKT